MSVEDFVVSLLSRRTPARDLRQQADLSVASSVHWDSVFEHAVTEEVYPLLWRNLKVPEIRDQRSAVPGLRSPVAVNAPNAGRKDAQNSTNAKREENEPLARSSTLHAPCYGAEGLDAALYQLEKLTKINAFRNTLLTEELVRVLNRLAEAGIPAIPLKGVALAQELYGDPAMRTCVDTDILVPREMVGKALRLLRDDGYKSEFASKFFGNVLLRHDIEYALRRQDRGFEYMLELHWGILWGGKSEKGLMDDLWAEAHPGTVFDAPAYKLSLEWNLLFLCVHAARHKWQGLKWLVDIHELCVLESFDWEKLRNKASRLGLDQILRITLKVCQKLFDTPVPSNYALGELPRWLKIFPESASSSWTDAFFATRFLPRFSDKVRYAARVLLIPTLAERRLFELPSFLGVLYYPLRPLRLACKWGGAALRSNSRERGAGSTERGVGDAQKATGT